MVKRVDDTALEGDRKQLLKGLRRPSRFGEIAAGTPDFVSGKMAVSGNTNPFVLAKISSFECGPVPGVNVARFVREFDRPQNVNTLPRNHMEDNLRDHIQGEFALEILTNNKELAILLEFDHPAMDEIVGTGVYADIFSLTGLPHGDSVQQLVNGHFLVEVLTQAQAVEIKGGRGHLRIGIDLDSKRLQVKFIIISCRHDSTSRGFRRAIGRKPKLGRAHAQNAAWWS